MNHDAPSPPVDTAATLLAPGDWHTVDVISDLHLHASEPATAALWLRYLEAAPFDALFILGDLFEVWVGDDVLDTSDTSPSDPEHQFVRDACAALRNCTRHRPVYVMHGNRDFLLGPHFFEYTDTQPLADPTVLDWQGHRWLFSHGDAWCLDDHDYMRFRAEVRTPAWQQTFLAQPRAAREAVGRQLRSQSEARKQLGREGHSPITYADVDTPTARAWLQGTGAGALVHGHTHRPGHHTLGEGQERLVLSDWDAQASPPRAEALRLQANGSWTRVPLTA